jgi:hypothetical protein
MFYSIVGTNFRGSDFRLEELSARRHVIWSKTVWPTRRLADAANVPAVWPTLDLPT